MGRTDRAPYPLDQSPFYKLRSKSKLAEYLFTSRSHLKRLSRSSHYHERFDQGRLIEEPQSDLKDIQSQVSELLARIEKPDYIHSPARGRSNITNASAHLGAPVLRRLDIRKHFPSITSGRIYTFFYKKMQCAPDIAGILADICTLDGHLPTGSPSSPMLSYFALLDMWERIFCLVNNSQCKLTVYADDVTISGDKVSGELIWDIKKIFRCYGLHDNRKKEKNYSVSTTAREVTGVIIHQNVLKAPHRRHLKLYNLRQQLRNTTDPEQRKELLLSLRGVEANIQQINQQNE